VVLGNGTTARAWNGGRAHGDVDTAAGAVALARGDEMDEAEALAGWRGGHAVLLG
jgi:hypothetical protein